MDNDMDTAAYDPKTVTLLSFSDAVPAFADGSDTPRGYLERCIETIEAREPAIKAFVTLNLDGARNAADASTARYRDGRPLSELDGLPVALKDVHETEDMPMQVGSPIFEGWSSGWDGACVHALRKAGRRDRRQDRHDRVRLRHAGPDTQPLGYRTHPRRLVQR